MGNRWLLEEEVWAEEEEKRLLDALSQLDVEVFKYRLGDNLKELDSKLKEVGIPTIGRGSIDFIKRSNCVLPWAYVSWPEFRCSNYYCHLSDFLMNKSFVFLPWGLLPQKKDLLYSFLGKKDQIFIRPDTNDKVFSGRVVSIDKFDKWYQQESDCYDPCESLQCVIARPEEIKREWRFICSVNSCEILGSCCYGAKDAGGCLIEEQTDKVLKILIRLKENPDILGYIPFVVLDMAETEKGFELIEIGCINCCSWYSCDPVPIVKAINEHAKRDF